MVRLFVCGGLITAHRMNQELSRLHAEFGICEILCLDKPGAPRLAMRWADDAGIATTRFIEATPADVFDECEANAVLVTPGGAHSERFLTAADKRAIPVWEMA